MNIILHWVPHLQQVHQSQGKQTQLVQFPYGRPTLHNLQLLASPQSVTVSLAEITQTNRSPWQWNMNKFSYTSLKLRTSRCPFLCRRRIKSFSSTNLGDPLRSSPICKGQWMQLTKFNIQAQYFYCKTLLTVGAGRKTMPIRQGMSASLLPKCGQL